ncbi:MAG TPA: PqiC family protein [Usitatibacter sp.]|jgi:hypothetical protein|nr:PqiC family protein [Usitatibacter sp.]
MKAIPLALFAVLGACATASAPEQDYTLSVETSASPVRSLPDVSIAVGAARIPEMYDRPQLVVRASENRVRLLEQQRWAEPLKSGIPRVVAADLGRLLGTTHTTSYPTAEASDTGYRVALEVQRFDATPGQGVDVDIAWRIHRLPGGPVRDGRTSTHEAASGEYEALVAAQSRALATVSRDIAQAIAASQGS